MQELLVKDAFVWWWRESEEPQVQIWWVLCSFKIKKNALVQVYKTTFAYVWSNVWLLSWKIIKQSNASEQQLEKVTCALNCDFPDLQFVYCTRCGDSEILK